MASIKGQVWSFHPSSEASAAGNLYVAGGGVADDNSAHAIVRTAAADGTGWTTLDDWQMASGRASGINGLLVDHTGALYSAGLAHADAWSLSHGIVRRIDTPSGAAATFSTTMVTDPWADEDEESEPTATVGPLQV